MFGWVLLKASTTFFSTAVCSGASPPPMQQNHRIWTGPFGPTVAGPAATDGATEADAASLGAGDAVALADGALDPPQADATTAIEAIRTPGRDRRACMAPPSVLRLGPSSGARGGRDGLG